eukprot:400666_1
MTSNWKSYNLFVDELQEYISNHHLSTLIANQSHNITHCDFFDQLFQIILSYCCSPPILLFDFFQKKISNINANSTINCLAKYPIFEENIDNIYDEQSAEIIWIAIDNHLLCYSPSKNTFTQQIKQVRAQYATIQNAQRYPSCVTHINSCFMTKTYKLVMIANNGYDNNNILVGCRGNFHWKGFMPMYRGRDISQYYGQFHYITNELLGILGWLWVGSATEIVISKPHNMPSSQVTSILYQQKNCVYHEIERIKANGNNASIGNVLKSINSKFNMIEDILLIFDDINWILFIPINMCKQTDINIIFNNKSEHETNEEETIDIRDNTLDFVYRITKDYVLYRGRRFNPFTPLIIESFKPNINYFNGFDTVFNDCRYNRFLVTKHTKLFEIGYNFENKNNILVKKKIYISKSDELKLNIKNIKQYYVAVEKEDYKLETLFDLYESVTITQAIIYCNTRRKVMWLTDKMKQHDFTVFAIHNDMYEKEKQLILKQFHSGSKRVLIATDLDSKCFDDLCTD